MVTRVGIIGGGQLARMMGEEIVRKSLPFELTVLDPTPGCPAAPFARQIVGDYMDEKGLRELAKSDAVITFEIERANLPVLNALKRTGTLVRPDPRLVHLIQDKYEQKRFLVKNSIPVPDFSKVDSLTHLNAGLEEYGFPAVLKQRHGGYDGRGNFVVPS